MERPRRPGRRASSAEWDRYHTDMASYNAQQQAARVQSYRAAISRPEGVQKAGNTWVDGQPGYYEDGGTTGRDGHRDRYSGPLGPFGAGHHHDGSEDGGDTWERYH